VTTFACVNVQNFESRGAEYVDKLFHGISRHMPSDWRGVCLTDDPECVPWGIDWIEAPANARGWWAKLGLFKPGAFPQGERVVFFDLDTMIVGDLSDIAGYQGRFAMLRDIAGSPYGSGVMAFEAGACDHIWKKWVGAGRPTTERGDQEWIGRMEPDCDALNHLYPGQLVSFKMDVAPQGRKPPDARVIYFHGRPRPHELSSIYA